MIFCYSDEPHNLFILPQSITIIYVHVPAYPLTGADTGFEKGGGQTVEGNVWGRHGMRALARAIFEKELINIH